MSPSGGSGKRTPTSMPIAVPEGEFDSPDTGVIEDPMEGIRRINTRLKTLTKEHRENVENDKKAHEVLGAGQTAVGEKIDAVNEKVDNLGARMDHKFDLVNGRLDTFSNAQIRISVAEKESQIQVNTAQRTATIATRKELVVKFAGPIIGAIGGVVAAYLLGMIHGC